MLLGWMSRIAALQLTARPLRQQVGGQVSPPMHQAVTSMLRTTVTAVLNVDAAEE